MWRLVVAVLGIWLAGPGAARAETIHLVTGAWQPYSGRDLPGGGSFVRRVTDTFEAAGHEVEMNFMPWKRAYQMVRHGQADVTVPWYKTETRMAEVAYPEKPVGVTRAQVYYKQDRFPNGVSVDSLDDVAAQGLRTIGIDGYWYVEHLKALDTPLHLVAQADLAWRMLDRGRGDVYVEATQVAEYEVPRILGPKRMTDFASAGMVNARPMYVLFTPDSARGDKLRKIWDTHAGDWNDTAPVAAP